MNWLLVAIIGHIANGIAFAIDKSLLRSAFSRSATYAGIVGGLSCLVLLAAPWVTMWPTGSALVNGLVSGATFVFALWAFFGALSRGEASRIVPIVGSLIPLLTLAQAYVFLHERLGTGVFVGIGLLVLATILLTVGGSSGRPPMSAVYLGMISALLFAVSSVTAKAVYDATGFLGGFVTTRAAAAVAALLILIVFDRVAGAEVWGMLRPAKKGKAGGKHPSTSAALVALVGQSLGAIGFVLVQWATSQGSPSVVNALQAVQYAFLVLLALALRKRAKTLLGEELTRDTLAIKAVALTITAIGMYLIV